MPWPFEPTIPNHVAGEAAGDVCNCPECYWWNRLCHLPRREAQRRIVQGQRRGRGLPPPLPEKFLHQLAAALVEHKDLFGPILRHLVNHEFLRGQEAGEVLPEDFVAALARSMAGNKELFGPIAHYLMKKDHGGKTGK